jgi:hypothetical protein
MTFRTFFAAALMLAGAATATAAPVAYHGAVFDFSITPVSGSTYTLTYTADFANFADTSGNQGHLAAINWKIAGAGLQSVSLLDTNAAGNWGASLVNNNVDAKGCKSGSNGGKGFVCLEAQDWLAQATEGSLYWTFNVTFDTALSALQLENQGNPIRALFAREDLKKGGAKQGGLMSCETGNLNGECGFVTVADPIILDPQDLPRLGTVSEPGIATMLGLGVFGLVLGQRRRKQA